MTDNEKKFAEETRALLQDERVRRVIDDVGRGYEHGPVHALRDDLVETIRRNGSVEGSRLA